MSNWILENSLQKMVGEKTFILFVKKIYKERKN